MNKSIKMFVLYDMFDVISVYRLWGEQIVWCL